VKDFSPIPLLDFHLLKIRVSFIDDRGMTFKMAMGESKEGRNENNVSFGKLGLEGFGHWDSGGMWFPGIETMISRFPGPEAIRMSAIRIFPRR